MIDTNGVFRIGIAGPVGSGKTACVLALCQELRESMSLAVVTNDIYTEDDALFLRRHSALEDERFSYAARAALGCCWARLRSVDWIVWL